MGEGTEGVTTSFKAVMQHTITASASSGGTDAATSKRRQMLTTYVWPFELGYMWQCTSGAAAYVSLPRKGPVFHYTHWWHTNCSTSI